MAWFVAEVWVLCAVAFLLGAGVTWLLFGRPQRAPRPEPASAPVVAVPAVRPVEPQPAAGKPGADPALAALDTAHPGVSRGIGVRASGALDLLGVTPSGLPAIPTQPGPPDDTPRK